MSEWIKCSERMPPDNEEVLAYHDNNWLHGGLIWLFVGWRRNGRWYLDDEPTNDICNRAVTHWMPLPPPPTEKAP